MPFSIPAPCTVSRVDMAFESVVAKMSERTGSTRNEQRVAVGQLLYQVQAVMMGELDSAVAPFDLSVSQYVILSVLECGRADTPSQLCRETSYSPGGMTRVLDRLEQKGMICRLRDLGNRRSVKLVLTDKCQRLFPDVLAAATTALDRFFFAHDQADLQQLEALLMPLLGHCVFLNPARTLGTFSPSALVCRQVDVTDSCDGFRKATRTPSFISHTRSRT